LCQPDGQVTETLVMLARCVEKIVKQEPTLLSASVPSRIFGDLHGQFRDLLLWLKDFGFPHRHGPTYIFNGDFVDRGARQLETVALIFALKVAFPSKVVLVRGNHEFRDINEHMGATGFRAACDDALGFSDGDIVYEAFHNAFDSLPLGCLLAEKVLVVHGGLGDGNWSLDLLANVERPLTAETVIENQHIYNVLWSDPIPETIEQSFGVHDSPRDGHRGMVLAFGKDVTEDFCQRNKIEAVVRSHQAKRAGCGYEVMHGSRLIRVFSARDYEHNRNDGAMLKVRRSKSGHIIIRAQLLRSIDKARDPLEGEGMLAQPPVYNTGLFHCGGGMCGLPDAESKSRDI